MTRLQLTKNLATRTGKSDIVILENSFEYAK